MSDARSFVVTVAMTACGERSTLFAMAAVLHRRGVEVVEAEMGRASHGRRIFSATFISDPGRANTIVKSFGNVIDVVDASLYEAVDARTSIAYRVTTNA